MPNPFLPENQPDQAEIRRIPVGPYAGSTIRSLPDHYLARLLDMDNLLEKFDLEKVVKDEWKRRAPKTTR